MLTNNFSFLSLSNFYGGLFLHPLYFHRTEYNYPVNNWSIWKTLIQAEQQSAVKMKLSVNILTLLTTRFPFTYRGFGAAELL